MEAFFQSILILFFGTTPNFLFAGDQDVFELGLPLHEERIVLNPKGLFFSYSALSKRLKT